MYQYFTDTKEKSDVLSNAAGRSTEYDAAPLVGTCVPWEGAYVIAVHFHVIGLWRHVSNVNGMWCWGLAKRVWNRGRVMGGVKMFVFSAEGGLLAHRKSSFMEHQRR